MCTCRVYTCRVCTCARCVRMYTCTYIYTYILTRLSKVSRLLRFFLFPMFRICRQSREKKVSIENSIYRLVLSSNVITRMISSLISSKNEKPFLPFLYYFIIIFFYYYYYYRCFFIIIVITCLAESVKARWFTTHSPFRDY